MRHTVSVQKISQPRVECLLTTKGYGIVLCFFVRLNSAAGSATDS